jgi:hypothetical protein
MIYTAQFLIEKRKEKWEHLHSVEEDRKFREAVANELYTNKKLLIEIKENPEYLIELEFVIVNKKQQTVPFFINDVQQEFISIINNAKKDYRNGLITDLTFLVLKGRQQGFTSFITAYQLAISLLNKNFQGFTLADKTDNTEAIFQNKAKFPYEQLPDIIKPTEKFNNKRQLLFEKLNSNWSVDTATENVGRSRTINFFHGSECGFWKSISKVQAGLGEAFTIDCIKIYESTANGYNDFQKMWENGTGIKCFFEWWKTKEYRTNFESNKTKEDFINKVYNSNEWIFERIKILIENKHLELEQVYWYYKKYEKYIDKDLIKQEYPCSAEEAFLASGNCIFDKEKIINRIQQLKGPIKQGYFKYETYYNEKENEVLIDDNSIQWVEDVHGYIKVYEEPIEGYPYVLGGDTAGDGSDNFTGQALNNITGNQAAVLKHQFDEDMYAKQMYCLGICYNKALIGIETNYSTYPNKELERLQYPNLFIREKEDTYTHKPIKSYGFETNKKTRPIIIARLVEEYRDNIEQVNDKDTLKEALTFIKNENGRPEAQEGYHDDLIMAKAIAHYIRPSQTYLITKKEEERVKEYNPLDDLYEDDTVASDYGMKINII